jgi:vacuolar-type H+-ATPase subunit I/STV1
MQPASVEAQLRTRAFARVIGPYVATFGIVYAVRLPELTGLVEDLFAQPFEMLMLGALMLAAGLIIIGLHRSWRGPLAVTISLFGWFVAIRGLLLIATPSTVEAGAQSTLLSPTATVVARGFFAALGALGLVLAYAGWFNAPNQARTQLSRD